MSGRTALAVTAALVLACLASVHPATARAAAPNGSWTEYHNDDGHAGYDQQDFQDMNQVTRRGTNWRNLAGDGEDKSMEFSDGPHNCVAIKKAGPRWQGGYVYMMHASVCRTDTAAIRAEDIAYALSSLEVRQHDPVGNLRPPP